MFRKIIFSALIVEVSSLEELDSLGSKNIKGNGKVVSVNRTTSDYDRVIVGGSFDVILVKGKEGKITIEGEENIIPYLAEAGLIFGTEDDGKTYIFEQPKDLRLL